MDSPWLDGSVLFLAASVHEDVAVLLAALFVREHGLAPAAALTGVYVGALANNYAIYGIGALARRLPGLRRWLIDDKVKHVRRRLGKKLVSTLIVCRCVPGSLTPVILGCGWLGVSFARFALVIALTAAVYIVLLAALVFSFGDVVLNLPGKQPWLVMAVLCALVVGVGLYRVKRARVSGQAD